MGLEARGDKHMSKQAAVTSTTLARQNAVYAGTAACSAGNRGQGFRPAFLDTETGKVYRSCMADGRPAPIHLLDGLPPSVVVARTAQGRVAEVKSSIVAGFIRELQFYTRDEARTAAEAEAEPEELALAA
jgi:hypothetical protein